MHPAHNPHSGPRQSPFAVNVRHRDVRQIEQRDRAATQRLAAFKAKGRRRPSAAELAAMLRVAAAGHRP